MTTTAIGPEPADTAAKCEIKPALRTLVEAARWAPSGDNTQPWKFHVDNDNDTVIVELDPTRDTSPMNAGQRMARIAVGAAVENIVQTATHNGWQAECEILPTTPISVAVRLSGLGERPGEVPRVILDRCTNRKLYDGRPLDPELLARLKTAVQPPEGITIRWVTERSEIESLAKVIGEADGRMFNIPEVRQAFLDNIRFDRPATEAVSEGLSLGSLELSQVDSLALRVLGHIPAWCFRAIKLDRSFRNKAGQLAYTASGLCVLSATVQHHEADVATGRTLERLWLALARSGLAVQPMMSLPVLRAMDRGANLNLGIYAETCALLRFGNALHPSVRTGRLPIFLSQRANDLLPQTKKAPA
jgi:hypothetical protein